MEMEAGEYPETEMIEEAEEDSGMALPMRERPQCYGRPQKSCHATADLCLRLIHKAICKSEWERAAGLLARYLQALEDYNTDSRRKTPEIIWRVGNEILLNHPKATNDDINVFNEFMKNIGLKNYLWMSLEQTYHLLSTGQTDEAHRVLSLAESWRHGRLSIGQNKLQKLIQAHRAVLNYRSWVDKNAATSQNDQDYASRSSAAQLMGSSYRQATVTFQEMLQFPGVWDPFILNYVHLLKSSGENQEVEKVLTEYAYNTKNPPNPNALVYLYEFLKRSGAEDERLLKVLRDLYAMTPSHKLMVKFSKLLLHSDSEDDQLLSLHVLFDLLDFSTWKENVRAWSYLARRLKNAFCCGRSAWVLEAWKSRRSWWPSYHFTKYLAKKDWRGCAELAMKKALVAGALQGPACVYYTAICARGRHKHNTDVDRMKNFIMMHNCENIPEPDAAELDELD